MAAQRSPSPLTSLDPSSSLAGSSPIRSIPRHGNNDNDQGNHLDAEDDATDGSNDPPNRHSSRDPTYDPDSPRRTSTGTPLRNKPYAQRTISEDSASRLNDHAHEPAKCILTHFEAPSGLTVERPHMIPNATRGQKLREYEWMLGYKATELDIDSHYNITYLVGSMHKAFDDGNWALVPEQSVREQILLALQGAKAKMGAVSGNNSSWPLFDKVYFNSDGIYLYRAVNIKMNCELHVFDEVTKRGKLLDWNEDVPNITIRSHVHPLHVIMNAYPKFKAWHPSPTDALTLDIINDICTIWELLKSVRPTDDYLRYTNKPDPWTLGVPSETSSRTTRSCSRGSRSDGSSLGKRSEREDDDDGAKDAGSRRRYEGTSHTQHPTEDDIPELQDSLSSREPSVDSSVTDYIRAWQDGVAHDVRGDAGGLVDGHENADLGSLKVTGYKGWKPVWDRRRVDTKTFSSNDWAFYHNTCDLTGDYPVVRFS